LDSENNREHQKEKIRITGHCATVVQNGDEVSFMKTRQIIFYTYTRARERYNIIKLPRVAPVCCIQNAVRLKSAKNPVTGIYPKLLHVNLVRGAMITLSLLAACVPQRIQYLSIYYILPFILLKTILTL